MICIALLINPALGQEANVHSVLMRESSSLYLSIS